MPNTHTTLTSLFSDIADAIRGKTGSSATIVADDFPTAIASIPTGGGSAIIEPLSVTTNGTYAAPSGVDGYSPITVNVLSSGVTTTEESNSTGTTLYINSGNSGGVRFIDYDGTILHSYSVSEFANLTAMPTNPSHAGLTAQGWNWSLADAKAQMVAQPNDTLTIGQMYVTNDGKTRVYISLVDSARLSPYLGICPNGTVVVDWGDNTTTDTLTGISLSTVKRAQHTYASTGDYVITLEVTSGEFAIYGVNSSSNGSYLLNRTNGNIASQKCYLNAIQKIELGEDANIHNYAFAYCYSLSSITIPNDVTSIGNNAFYHCHSLSSITFPSDVTSIGNSAFAYCYSLSSITIPNGVTSIGTDVFFYCNSLSSITIPSGVTSIGDSAFNGCYSLSSITVPSGVTHIGAQVFYNCYSLLSIAIPSSVTSMGNSVFSGCNSLSSITISNGVTSIGNSAFYNCNSLTSITIPSSVTSMGSQVFYYCYSLTSITIPNSVTSIGTQAFQACSSLTSITIPNGVTSIGSGAFQGCNSLSSITIPSDVMSIDNNTFNSCYSLTSITIPSSVTSIGNSAFNSCNSLSSIIIPSGVTSIGNNAFQYCYSLTSITIPSSVTSIGSSAFQYCYGVAEYHFLPTTPPTLADTAAFSGILDDCKIYVPAASLTAYQEATNWSTYASYMVGE